MNWAEGQGANTTRAVKRKNTSMTKMSLFINK